MNIHLMDNEKFIQQFIERFNRFHSDNYYFILENSKEPTVPEDKPTIVYTSANSFDLEKKICKLIGNSDDLDVNVFIHYLTGVKAEVVNKLQKFFKIQTFWIFYGADLYDKLQKEKSWDLIENFKSRKRILSYGRLKITLFKLLFRNKKKERKNENLFIANLDFFCFWNPGDYNLLNEYFSTRADFKPFLYNHISSNENLNNFFTSVPGVILVNHSASEYGNHLTVLKALNRQDIKLNLVKIILPLSYGSREVRDSVLEYGTKLFEGKLLAPTSFIPKDEYEKMLRSVSVAIFGHKRQQAGFNIFYLLTTGVKVILRQENNLFNFFIENGVKVFLFSTDLTPKDIVNDLTYAEKMRNREIILNMFSKKKVDEMYQNLLN